MAQPIKDAPLLSLSTKLEKPATIEIDAKIYEIFGSRHVSQEQEIRLTVMQRRYELFSEKLEEATDDEQSANAARELQKLRYSIIDEFTTIPSDILTTVPFAGQVRLLEIIGQEMRMTAPGGEQPR